MGNPIEKDQSLVQGRVNQKRAIRRPKVVVSKAEVIEHSVRIVGSLEESELITHEIT